MGHKGHWGEYTGNAKWSRDHAHTRVTSKNYDDAVKDDAAHIDYLKRDINYDAKHGHSDEKMTADEKHISKLAGDMKYDKKHHGSAAKHINEFMDENHQHNRNHDERPMHSHKNFEKKKTDKPKKPAAPQMSALHTHNDAEIKELQKKITEAKERGKKYGGDDTGSPDYDVIQDVEQDVKAYTAQIKKLSEAHNKDKESDAAPKMHCMGKK